jgi:hypothetical protein
MLSWGFGQSSREFIVFTATLSCGTLFVRGINCAGGPFSTLGGRALESVSVPKAPFCNLGYDPRLLPPCRRVLSRGGRTEFLRTTGREVWCTISGRLHVTLLDGALDQPSAWVAAGRWPGMSHRRVARLGVTRLHGHLGLANNSIVPSQCLPTCQPLRGFVTLLAGLSEGAGHGERKA